MTRPRTLAALARVLLALAAAAVIVPLALASVPASGNRRALPMAAKLKFFYGPMDCGKSTLALQIDHNHARQGRRGLLLTRHDRSGAPTSLSTQRRRTTAPLPVLVAYGRQDTVPGVVESVPRLRRRDPTAGEVTVLVHPTGAHAFDVLQAEDPDTRRIVEQTVDWLAERLGQTV